jgi:hypothetical protein
MRKLSLVAAILLLSSAWVLAQSGTSPSSDQNPSSTSPSQTSPSSTSPSAQQPAQQPDTSSSSAGANTVEGCVGGSAGNFTLTDASGKTYQLSGDTSKLADHVGHQVRITGDEGAGAAGAASSGATSGSAGGSNTLNVKKVKMISSSCPSK